MQAVPLLILSWFLAGFPGQLSGLPAQAKRVSSVMVERHEDVCMGLSAEECCSQKLQIAGFRATGDQLPRATKTPMRLSCSTPEKVFPETSCRLLSMARGFNVKDAASLCAPAQLTKHCQGDASCKQCVEDLGKLDWKAPARACAAVTFVERPSERGQKVVKLTRRRDGTLVSASSQGNGVQIKRTTVR